MHTSGRSASHCMRRGKCTIMGLLLLAAGGITFVTYSQAAVRVGPEYTFPGNDHGSCDIGIHPGTGQPHVIWETNDGHVRYSFYDGSRWSTPRQLPGVANVGAREDRFRYGAVTMEIDSAGRVHVVYTTGGTRSGVYHVRQVSQGGAWSAPLLVHDAGRAQPMWVQMARNSRDQLYVSFEQGLRAFCCEYDGSRWVGTRRLADRTSHVHHIAMGPDGVPRILFKVKDRSGYEAYLATKRPAGWDASQITSDGGDTDCPSGAVDASNRLHVIWSKCAEEGHDAVLKYGTYAGARMQGTVLAKTNAHNFCRMVVDEAGALYVFMPRRYPPKFLVREAKGKRWSAPMSLGDPKQGYWFLEAAAHGNEVHLIYSNWYRADRPKSITYRKITRMSRPPSKPSALSGALTPHPSNSRWFTCGEDSIALSGNGIWVLIPDADVDPVQHNAHAQTWGANTNRITLLTGCDRVNDGEFAPWVRPGPGKANDGRPKYDLTRFDKGYWDRAVQYVRDAVGRGIFPVIQIWGEPYLERGEGRWIVHPFNPDNHVNEIPGLPTGSADAGNDTHFYNTQNRKLMLFQECFVTKALDELARFPVIWDIGNEVGLDSQISDLWIKHWTDFFDAYEASHPGITVLCTIDTNGDRGHFDRVNKLDVVNVHGFEATKPFTLPGDPERNPSDSRVDVKGMQRTLNAYHQRFRRPLINTRLSGDPDYTNRPLRDRPGNALETRHVLWGHLFGGAHFISFRTPDATGANPAGWDDPPLTTEHAQLPLSEFITSFEFSKCVPEVSTIVATGDAVVLAERGRRYAFYAPNGSCFGSGFTADLSKAAGTEFQARWFNPRSGGFGAPFRITAGPAVRFTLPTDEDWALLLESDEATGSKDSRQP